MSGSIMPTPLAMPVTVAPPTCAVDSLAWVSVVMMAPAAACRPSSPGSGGHASWSRWLRSRSIGYGQPITPVDATTMSSVSTPTRSATRSCSSTASRSPTAPLATLAFLETTTTPLARPEATASRLSVTDGPAKRDLVKTPATEHSTSGAITQKSSESSLTPALATWTRNPCGSADTPAILREVGRDQAVAAISRPTRSRCSLELPSWSSSSLARV